MHSGYQKDIKNKRKLQERKTGVGKGEDTEGKHREGEWEREGKEQRREGGRKNERRKAQEGRQRGKKERKDF